MIDYKDNWIIGLIASGIATILGCVILTFMKFWEWI